MNYFLITYGPLLVGLAISLALNRIYNWNIYTLIAMTTVFVWMSYSIYPVILSLLFGQNSSKAFYLLPFNLVFSVPLVLLNSPYYIVFILLLKAFNLV